MGGFMLHSNNQPIFAIHGGGNIGLGCMAEIVNNGKKPYQIIATSSDRDMNQLINSKNRYWLVHNHEGETTCIDNVKMIYSRHKQNIVWLYTHADILALCLTEKGLVSVIDYIADGIISRYELKKEPLEILILMNHPKSEELLKHLLFNAILIKRKSKAEMQSIMSYVMIIPTVVDRIVSKIDSKKVIASFQQRKNKLYLFKAERNYLLYAPTNFSKARHFPKIKTVNNIRQFAEIKNKYLNGPHSMLAWMGGLMGCKTIAETIQKPSLYHYVNTLMENEIAPILQSAYPNLNYYELKSLKKSFLKRCKENKDDPVIRVGRDPIRKLKSGERVRGIIELKQKLKLPMETPQIERGIAAGIMYAINEVDPKNDECQQIKALYTKHRSYKAILCSQGLDQNKDQRLINNVIKRISSFKKLVYLRQGRRIKL